MRVLPPFDRLCRALAVAGGALLALAGLVTVVSVAGRYLFTDAIAGDSEIVSVLTAVAVALFLPWCQLAKGNVIVDVFTEQASVPVKAVLDALGSLLLLVIAAVLAWRLSVGGFGLAAAHDETMVLRLPTWIGLAVAVPCFAVTALAALVAALRREPA